ncbi:hypothetical protein [Xanthocytophaga agilis]|uniref:Uncharacterized protein n=1 Tax=Xanthocytophaga agilis TaxID=3048010 RepID=A0AAE3QYP2_9BACT|nr:hypothetical protein [Xanthocytophaga agilis]MDJ1500474.1 hypothetical protein [Xanthocytophaga agilis]
MKNIALISLGLIGIGLASAILIPSCEQKQCDCTEKVKQLKDSVTAFQHQVMLLEWQYDSLQNVKQAVNYEIVQLETQRQEQYTNAPYLSSDSLRRAFTDYLNRYARDDIDRFRSKRDSLTLKGLPADQTH